MADPKNKPQVEDQEEWVTLSGETLRERYERVRTEEANLTFEEWEVRLKKGRENWLKLIGDWPETEDDKT